MKQEPLILKYSDFDQFRTWLRLDVEAITWQGRFAEEFEEFWRIFFSEGISFIQLMERFEYAQHEIKIGPLSSWFNWLRQKMIIFSFIHYDLNLFELCREGRLDMADTANCLRLFFLDKFPHLEAPLNEVFQVGNILSPNIYINFKTLVDSYSGLQGIDGTIDYEVMPAMEITLYREWKTFYNKLKKDLMNPQFNYEQIRNEASLRAQWKFLRELLIMLAIGIVVIGAVKYVNQGYEKYLVNKISVYEPQFMWLDKTLKFIRIARDENSEGTIEIPKVNFDEIKSSDVDREVERSLENSTNFGTETDVTLTSWDSLPKDFATTQMEQSEYEEINSEGYRDFVFGSKKVYRVILNAADSQGSRDKINALLSKYAVEQADNVRPGIAVPGGYYYNLYVPLSNLKEFIATVMEVGDATLYESRTARSNPPGKNKLLIWIKTI